MKNCQRLPLSYNVQIVSPFFSIQNTDVDLDFEEEEIEEEELITSEAAAEKKTEEEALIIFEAEMKMKYVGHRNARYFKITKLERKFYAKNLFNCFTEQ